MKMRSVFKILIPVLFSSQAWGAERFEFYTGIRQMGMGGAVVATVNDETAVLSNPSGLGKLRDSFFTIADPEVSGNGGAYSLGTEAAAGRVFDPAEVNNFLIENPKEIVHYKAQVFPSIVFKNFGLGVLIKYEQTAYIDEETDNFVYNYYNDTALALGYNLSLWEGRIKLGFNAKAINRVEMNYEVNQQANRAIKLANEAREGVGISGDGSLILTGPWTWLPQIAAVMRDVGNTRFNQNDGLILDTQERPKNQWSSLDVGLSVSPILSNESRMQIALEYRDAMRPFGDDEHPMARYHAGLEFNMWDAIFIRGGMNQSYYTAGLEIATGFLQFQAATYGEEIGTATNPREDRRYVGKISIRF